MVSILDKKFFEFHHNNPHVYDLIMKYIAEVRRAGYARYSIKAIISRIRWHMNIETRSRDGFKISNSHSSRYARLVIKNNQHLKDFFQLKELKTDSVLADI